ncbi:MAG: lycopene cyclase domain-containing protein [Candidatus Paceibacterota bacterium]
MEYLLILLVFLFSGIFLKWKYNISLYDSSRARIVVPLLFLIVGLTWDYFAVHNNHWNYSGEGLVGVNIGSLPIEEYLFMLIVPF